MKDHNTIISFLRCVRDRLNFALLLRVVQWGMLAAGLVMLAGCGFYLFQGRAVSEWVYSVTFILFLLGTSLTWLLKRYDVSKAGGFADKFFNLHDGVISFGSFQRQGKEGGFYELQADQLEKEVARIGDVKLIGLGVSKRLVTLSAAVIVCALLLGLVDDSQAYKQEMLAKELILSKSKQVNEELKKELDKTLDELTEEEGTDEETKRELNELKRMVESLKITDDQKMALSQYAKIERKLYKMLNSAQQRKDELMLSRVADKLKSIRDGRKIGDKLSQKDYKAAADELKKLKLDSKQKDSEQAKKQLAKLKSISQQMASAAASCQSCSSGQEGQNSESKSGDKNNSSNNNQNPKNSSENSGNSVKRQTLSNQISNLNKSVENFQKNQCQSNCSSCNQGLGQIGDSLSRLGAKRSMQFKMQSLFQKLGQCQSSMCNGSKPGQGSKPGAGVGGKKAGDGSVDSRTDKTTPDIDNGNIESLQGIKGSGPADVKVEETDSGSGISSQSGASSQHKYRKQAEAYINRQDIPPEVKQGVKHYFENIHNN